MVMRRGVVAAAMLALMLAACGGAAPVGNGGGTVGGGTGARSTDQAAEETLDIGGLGSFLPVGGPAMRPSGAKFRVLNAYAPLNGDPGPVDVYAGFSVDAADKPLVTVPYGEISDWFDPGVMDEQGDANVLFYPAGKKEDDDQIMSKSETLKGTERVTAFLSSGSSVMDSGARFGQVEMIFENATTFPLDTPAPGKAVLIVDAIGLDNTLSEKDRFWFASTGTGCLEGVAGSIGNGPQPVAPGSRSSLAVEPGSVKVSLHEYPAVTDFLPACDNASVSGDMPVTLAPGKTTFLFLFSAGKDVLKWLVVPVGG